MKTSFCAVLSCLLVAQSWGQQSLCGEKGVLASGLKESEKLEVVNRHNYYRLQIANGKVSGQPKAANMKKMVWDDAIAVQAQNLVNTCKFSHTIANDPRWSWVGQNLYLGAASSINTNGNFTQAVDLWFSENVYYTYPGVTVAGKKSGHYTQVVWANTWAIGCGYAKFYDSASKVYKNYIACNYGPGGNYVGEAPYLTGPGCENLC